MDLDLSSKVWVEISEKVKEGYNILFIGPPSIGKSEFAREANRLFADKNNEYKRLVDLDDIIDLGSCLGKTKKHEDSLLKKSEMLVSILKSSVVQENRFFIGWLPFKSNYITLLSENERNSKPFYLVSLIYTMKNCINNSHSKFSISDRSFHPNLHSYYIDIITNSHILICELQKSKSISSIVEFCPALISLIYSITVPIGTAFNSITKNELSSITTIS